MIILSSLSIPFLEFMQFVMNQKYFKGPVSTVKSLNLLKKTTIRESFLEIQVQKLRMMRKGKKRILESLRFYSLLKMNQSVSILV